MSHFIYFTFPFIFPDVSLFIFITWSTIHIYLSLSSLLGLLSSSSMDSYSPKNHRSHKYSYSGSNIESNGNNHNSLLGLYRTPDSNLGRVLLIHAHKYQMCACALDLCALVRLCVRLCASLLCACALMCFTVGWDICFIHLTDDWSEVRFGKIHVRGPFW